MKPQQVLLGTAMVLGSAIALEAGTANAAAGWYFGLGAGVNWVEDNVINENDGSIFGSSVDPVSWDTGFVGTGALGYKWNNHWRAEFEVTYRGNDADSFCEDSDCVTSV